MFICYCLLPPLTQNLKLLPETERDNILLVDPAAMDLLSLVTASNNLRPIPLFYTTRNQGRLLFQDGIYICVYLISHLMRMSE